nr:PREDICTED: dnaJ homolog subfamily C member 10-like isoform X1 [Megachile rotundata]XP_012150042.1 PREDICTED: dnaJ homolog subfamily C member 10-like isoform X1 [Megachile rotundata]
MIIRKMYKMINIYTFIVIVDIISMSMGNDYYEILGVSKTADLKEIRRAFKKLAVAEHPDKNNDDPVAHDRFIQLKKAYETLKDPVLRKTYDNYGEMGLDNTNRGGGFYSWNYENDFELYANDPEIIKLNNNDYFESVINTEKAWIINFYSPMCSHCHRLAPVWRKLAKEFDGVVRIGAVNCEDEWQLCHQIPIQSYPTLMYYPKYSKDGERYRGEKTYTAITDFILNNLEVDIHEIDESLENFILRGNNGTTKHILIFVCGVHRNCFMSVDRLKIAAIFENVIDVKILSCDEEEKCKNMADSQDINAIYLSAFKNNSWHVVRFKNINKAEVLIEKLLEHLPDPDELDDDEFYNIKKYLDEGNISDSSWLLYFYIGKMTELDALLKRLFSNISVVKIGKINCGKHSRICSTFNVDHYPMWGILKPGGAFEFYRGKDLFNDIVKFVYSSIKSLNVWTLNEKQVISIMEGKNANEAWFLDWYAPWCPPCMHFLKEVRKASMEFDKSVVRFGTIDCTVYTTICQRQNIRSYPTAMLVNGTNVHKFSMLKTAANIVQFITETRNPTVIRLSLNNFEDELGQRMGKHIWFIEYFAPWCAPCQRLIPEWISVANSLSILSSVKVASVDCEAESVLCASQGIRSYPTIRIYLNENNDLSKFVSYNGQRDSVSILQWFVQFLPRKVRDLNPSTLKREVLNDRNTWIVDFYVPWCEHCRKLEPQLALVAQLMGKKIQFGRLNCEIYINECAAAEVRFYPTLMAYDFRYSAKKLANGYQISDTVADSIKRSILDFVARINHDEL